MNKLELIQIGKETKHKLNRFVLLILMGIAVQLLSIGIAAIAEFVSSAGSGADRLMFFDRYNNMNLFNFGMIFAPLLGATLGGVFQIRYNFKSYINYGSTPKTYYFSSLITILATSLILAVSFLFIQMFVVGCLESSSMIIMINTPETFTFTPCIVDILTNTFYGAIAMTATFMLGNMMATKKNIYVTIIVPIVLAVLGMVISIMIVPILDEYLYSIGKTDINLTWVSLVFAITFFTIFSVMDGMVMIKRRKQQ